MRDLKTYIKKAINMLESAGVHCGNIIDCEVNTRAKRWGQCRKVPDGYVISINASLLDERNAEDGLMNTILHELIHSVKGCFNHGKNWKAVAEKINRKYGYNIKRISSAEEKGVSSETIPKRNVKYKFVCSGCGAEVVRERASKFTNNCQNYHCAKCGGSFEQVY